MEREEQGCPMEAVLKGKEKNASCESFHSPRQGPGPLRALQQHPNMPLVLIMGGC